MNSHTVNLYDNQHINTNKKHKDRDTDTDTGALMRNTQRTTRHSLENNESYRKRKNYILRILTHSDIPSVKYEN